MSSLALVGTEASLAWQAARKFLATADIRTCPDMASLLAIFASGAVDFALFPVYNTREGEQKQQFRFFDRISQGYWVDNVVLYSQISLGVFDPSQPPAELHSVLGTRDALSQSEEYLESHLPHATVITVADVQAALATFGREARQSVAVLDSEERLRGMGLHVLEREIAPYNRTRFAVVGRTLAAPSGYDATVFTTEPLADRVGVLVDILGEFSRRGISIQDLRTENDVKTQKLRIYLEVEGHIQDPGIAAAVEYIENRVIQQKGAMRLLGSFPRVDMRTKHIRTIGFIGTGAMSRWFAERLRGEGYEVLLSGRQTELRPEEMIARADVVIVCVPISVTRATVSRYAPLLDSGKALILLAGESEENLRAALAGTRADVEVMLVHNLWGPRAATMRDKNAIVVRTAKSGILCSEFESFLYKHGAGIFHDTPRRHDISYLVC